MIGLNISHPYSNGFEGHIAQIRNKDTKVPSSRPSLSYLRNAKPLCFRRWEPGLGIPAFLATEGLEACKSMWVEEPP